MKKNKYLMISIVAVITLITATVLAIGNIATTSINIKQGREIVGNASTTGTKGTIINVPIDCRPAGTTEFQELVETAGFKYIEINSSLDNYNGSTYTKGTAATQQSALEQQVKNNNNSDTTVIINLSSYFFGGVKAARDANNYSDATISSNLDTLKNLITTYNKPTYYVSMVIPRSKPDLTINSLSNGVSANSTVAGLSGSSETFEQAYMDWAYLYYMKQAKGESWMPAKVKTWFENFETTYATQTTAYKKVYDSVYKYVTDSTKGLSKLAKDLGFELILNTESNELPESIADENISSDYISTGVAKSYYWDTDTNNNKIRYSGIKYCVDAALENYSALTVLHGVENINDVILAREIARKNNVKITYNYIEPLTGNNWTTSSGSPLNWIDEYDDITENEALKERSTFINKDKGSGSLTVDLYITNKAHSLTGTETSTFINTVIADSTANATGILDLKNLGNSTEYYDALVANDAIFKTPVYVDLSAITNASSKAMATTAVYASLQNDFKNASSIDDTLKSRLSAYTKIQLRNVLTDGVYYKKIKESGNYTVNSSDLKNRIIMSEGITTASSTNKNLITLLQNTKMKIAGKTYQVGNISIANATNPLNRDYEVVITFSGGTLSIDEGITAVTITPKNPTIKVGGSIQLTATTTPASTEKITWTSSSNSYATVDSTGKVTGLKAGSVKIKATTESGVVGSTIVEISENNTSGEETKVTAVTITPKTSSIKVGESVQLAAATTPASTEKITWTSTDDTIATVDNTGKVTGIKVGTVEIKATSESGVVGSATIEIKESNTSGEETKVTAVTITPKTSSIKVGESVQLAAATTPASTEKITWTSTDDTIATVDSTGKVTGIKAGTVEIKATSESGVVGSATIKINEKISSGNNTNTNGNNINGTGNNTNVSGNNANVSGNSTNIIGTNNSNNGTASSVLPNTGFLNRDLAILLTIIVASIGIGSLSYIKYKNIQIK